MIDKAPLMAATGFSLADDQYRHLQAALVQFFRSRGSAMPEDHASEAIVRILQGAARGVTIENLHAYAHGIAKHMLREELQETGRNVLPVVPVSPVVDEVSERCLSQCKRRCLSIEERRLIRDYYAEGAGAKKIARHRRLAEDLGITPEALRLRAHRIRKKLAACVEESRHGDRPPRKRIHSFYT